MIVRTAKANFVILEIRAMVTKRSVFRMWACVGAGLMLAALCVGAARSATTVEAGQDILRLDVGGVTFELVRIPAGTFLMGSNGGDSDERPVHEVSIADDFYMGKTEVTVRQFRAFVASTGYQTVAERQGAAWHMPAPDNSRWTRGCNWRSPPFEQRDDYPVVCLSYLDGVAFCAWLSARSGQPIRLPTEAQWEYACRAGAKGEGAIALEAVA
jgi:formylglycine-generating enzyme required for sulfatase activity